MMDPRSKPDCFNRTRSKPGIGRPYRYNTNTLPITKYNYSKNYQDFYTPSTSAINNEDEDVFETLIGMSKEKFYQSQAIYKQNPHHLFPEKKTRSRSPKSKFSLPPLTSKRPFRCPHKPCHKTVALAQFVNHFKSEHKDIPTCAVERGKELLLPCDVSLIEYNVHFCLAMITVYEINRVDYLKAGGSQSIVRTCNKFCQKIPINTFWLMVTGSYEKRPNSAYCIFWLFTNSDESYKCTIELGSRNDSVSLSTYCAVTNAVDKDFLNVKNKLHGLIVTKSSLRFILKEGALLNLRVIVH